jgi:Flp pilus assembly protein TadG
MRIIPWTMKRLPGQRGAVLLVVALLLFVLVGLAALAIDLGYSYVVKNELQNAADAAALAGGAVLFTDNQNCLSNGSPYHCCTGAGTGSCSPSVIDNASVTSTATAVATENNSGGNPVPAPNVEIGHYSFASFWGSPGTFTVNMTGSQMTDWQTQSFSTLNGNTNFINAVRVTVSRTDVPRFFSMIFGSSPLTVTVQAMAYVGFAGSLPPGALDAPIGICKQSLITDPACTSNCQYTCVNGRMINSSTGQATSNTGAWTNFTQPCETSNPSNVPSACSGANPTVVLFGDGMGTVGGQQTPVRNSVEDCWLHNCATSGPVTHGQNCNRPWKLTLPVIDCPGHNPGPCSNLVGAVEVSLIWMWGQNPDMENGPTQMTAYDAQTQSNITWSCPASCLSLRNCRGNDVGQCRGNCCWNDFVQTFHLQDANNIPPIVGPGGNELHPNDLATTMFFLPDCTPHAPQGGTGGENFGILARYPVLVK